MNIALLPGSVSRLSGGLFNSVRYLSESLSVYDYLNISVVGNRDEFTELDLEQWKTPPTLLYSKGVFGRASDLSNWLQTCEQDLLHPQFLWSYASIATLRWHRENPVRNRYVISPRGMLDPWAIHNSRWKKRIASVLFERNHLRHAACIHALCESEAQSIRAYGLTNPIAVIPNGIALPDICGIKQDTEQDKDNSGDSVKTMLFLGRIHPKKGLLQLIEAWQLAKRNLSDWVLVIGGWDDGGHLLTLKQRVNELGLNESICFAGSLYGSAKIRALESADAFILPSFSEGLPMAVLEAWAYLLPVLMTPQCNLPVGFATGAAMQIDHSPSQLACSLAEFAKLTRVQRQSMGRSGRALVTEQFDWCKIAGDMAAVYRWILGQADRPACVEG